MTSLTRCPACATVFRVEAAQLEARQGFVRCGQCAKVFDARASLTEEREKPADDEPLDIELYLGPPSTPPSTLPESTIEPEPAATPIEFGAAAPPELEPRLDGMVPAEVEPPVDAVALTAVEPRVTAEPMKDSLAEADTPPQSSPEYEFGPRARTRIVTELWAIGSVILLLGLGAQAAYLFRAELALAVPGSKPYLAAACRRLGCEVPPPRHPALLSIESSELQVDAALPGLLTLNATLRNRATFPQGHPSIELTLTDADDRPLARRVLAPPDYLGDRLAREPLFAAASEHPVRLHIDATAVRPTGYRLFLFYP